LVEHGSAETQNRDCYRSGQGIGRAIAELFAEEGARVFIPDLDEAAGQEAAAKLRNLGSDTTFFPLRRLRERPGHPVCESRCATNWPTGHSLQQCLTK
jgi:hypothetical protein